MIDIEIVWSRIKHHEDEVFYQIRGKEFTFTITGNYLNPPTNRIIPKSDFKKALEFIPLSDTTKIQNLQGPSYIYAILMDKRIRRDDW
jgi:hypothetical protein